MKIRAHEIWLGNKKKFVPNLLFIGSQEAVKKFGPKIGFSMVPRLLIEKNTPKLTNVSARKTPRRTTTKQSLEPIDERSELAAKKAGRKYKKQFIITLSHQKLVLFFKHTIYQVVHKKAKIINKIITK
jgi:hypothetical protein